VIIEQAFCTTNNPHHDQARAVGVHGCHMDAGHPTQLMLCWIFISLHSDTAQRMQLIIIERIGLDWIGLEQCAAIDYCSVKLIKVNGTY
jgi:hypothetical protein